MHIITGLLITALLGNRAKKRTQQAQSPLLALTWPIVTKHLLPGRVRFHIPLLVGDEVGVKRIEDQLSGVEGLDSVEANGISGSVLICYQPEKISPELLFAGLIRLLGLEKELERTPPPLIAKEIRNIGEALNRAVYTSTDGLVDLWTTIPLVLLVLGTRRIIREQTLTFPTGFTLLWWAYTGLFRRDNM